MSNWTFGFETYLYLQKKTRNGRKMAIYELQIFGITLYLFLNNIINLPFNLVHFDFWKSKSWEIKDYNPRKISGSANLDFFSGLAPGFLSGL